MSNNYDLNDQATLRTIYSGASWYGNYRTRTFGDIFSDYDGTQFSSSDEYFTSLWIDSPFAATVPSADLKTIFYLLYARYGNSSIASSDENRFIYQLHSIIFQYGPTWLKELDIQSKVRALTEEELQKGAINIMNNAMNPSTTPSTVDTNELPYVSQQNVSKTTRSKVDAYALQLSLLKDDVTENFLKKFQKLFLTIVEPTDPLWYQSEQYY